MRSAAGLALILSLAFLSLGLRPCEEEYEVPVAQPDKPDCSYDDPPPSRENDVHIYGPATCAHARQLVRYGPTFAYIKRHPVTPVSDDPRIDGDWVCSADRAEFREPAAYLICESGARRVEYVLARKK